MNLEHHIVSDHEEPCWHCGDPTRYIEINWQAYLCPDACTDAKWDEFKEVACRTSPPDDPFETPNKRHHRMYREYVGLTGQQPPRTQHPQNTLPETVLDKLRDRQDLVRWALGIPE